MRKSKELQFQRYQNLLCTLKTKKVMIFFLNKNRRFFVSKRKKEKCAGALLFSTSSQKTSPNKPQSRQINYHRKAYDLYFTSQQ